MRPDLQLFLHVLGAIGLFGATATVNSTDGKAAEAILKLTGGRGADTVIEAVGIPTTFELCEEIVAPGGVIVEGTCDEIGRISSWVDVTEAGPQHLTISLRLAELAAPLLRRALEADRRRARPAEAAFRGLDQLRDADHLREPRRGAGLQVAPRADSMMSHGALRMSRAGRSA